MAHHEDNEHGHNHDDEHHHHHEHSHGGPSCSKTLRLSIMLFLILGFFVVEIVVGHITHSLTLLADAFHMLSDFIALSVALLSVWISKRETSINTYGWVRAEILGALINSVFLMALCLSIFIEAIERFLHEHELSEINLLLYVACVGLLINIGGLFIFGHGHSHGGSHGHSHGHTSDHLNHDNDGNIEFQTTIKTSIHNHDADNSEDIEASKCLMDQKNISNYSKNLDKNKSKNKRCCLNIFNSKNVDLNIRAVFLHVLADALGSVIVIISALVNKYHQYLKIDQKYLRHVDPVLSLVLVILILCSTLPLLKEAAFILLQTVPKGVTVSEISENLKKIDGVVEIKSMHIWKLSENKIIASSHIKFTSVEDYLKIIDRVKNVFHVKGINETTLEPCFINDKMDTSISSNHNHNHVRDDHIC